MQQRIIKFRAWLPAAGNYIYGYEPLDGNLLKQGTYILEQFTGLLDKNDKEIYEGDIVRYRHLDDEGLATVAFADGSFSLNGFPLSNLYATSLEVIGNIHENPELLAPADQTFFPPQGSVSLHQNEDDCKSDCLTDGISTGPDPDDELYDPAKDPSIERRKAEDEPIPF